MEIKKIVLIGPRAGAAGFFHGPLWLYLNFPVYYLSRGNPIASGWFWIFLTVLILISVYWLAKKLLGKTTALISVLLLSQYMVPQTREFTHPQASMLAVPFFFYTFYQVTLLH